MSRGGDNWFSIAETPLCCFLRLDDSSTDLDLEHKTTNIFFMEFLLQRNYTLWSKRMFSDILTVWWRPKRLRCMSRDSTFDPFQRRNLNILDRKISRFRTFLMSPNCDGRIIWESTCIFHEAAGLISPAKPRRSKIRPDKKRWMVSQLQDIV